MKFHVFIEKEEDPGVKSTYYGEKNMNKLRNKVGSLKLFLPILLLLISFNTRPSYAGMGSTDWRADYNLMSQAYYVDDMDSASKYASNALEKIFSVQDQMEEEIALEQTIRMLRYISCKYEQKQNYSQQEAVLKLLLKAEEARHGDLQSFEITNAKRNLAACLVLEGKVKEAEAYLPKSQSNTDTTVTMTGWKKDLEMLRQSNKAGEQESCVKYGTMATDEALSLNNNTEKKAVLDEIIQQLQSSSYRCKDNNDYPNQEKILKLILKAQQEEDKDNPYSSYLSSFTMQELANCLVMERKDKEAEEYAAKAKENREKPMKDIENLRIKMEQMQQQKNDNKEKTKS